MQFFSLTIILHIILGCITRMVQGRTPTHVNLVKFRKYPQIWILPNFSVIRGMFVLLIFYNSLVLSFLFQREILIPYYLWYMVMVAWVDPFTSCRFYRAFQYMAVLVLCSVAGSFEIVYFCPNAIWCVYLLYISSWYNWCLPI